MKTFPGRLVRLAFSIVAIGAAGPAAGQVSTRETQVPIHPERDVVEIDAELRERLGLFGNIRGFRFARLFTRADGGYVLEITFSENGTLARERRTLDNLGVGDLRAVIEGALSTTGAAVDQSGRTGLVLSHGLLGLGFYGWAIPNATDMTGFRGPFATYMLTSGLSFVVPHLLTRSSEVTFAHREAAFWGGSRGIPAGLLLGGVLGDGASDDNRNRIKLGTAVGTSLLGSVLGYNAVDRLDLDRDQIETVGVIGDFGLAGGFTMAYAAGLYDPEQTFIDGIPVYDDFEETWQGNAFALAVTGGSVATALWRARAGDYSGGDAHLLRASGLLGAQIGLPFGSAIDDNSDKALAWSGLVGATLGTLAADRLLTPGRDFSRSEGLLITAGQIAGGLLAAGITVLADEEPDRTVILGTIAAGSALGYGILYGTYAGRAKERRELSGGLDVQFSLSGLLLPLLNEGRREGPPTSAPILTIRF